jgi:hypothetical protein
MTDNITKLPEPGVTLDLDAAERDAKDVKDPFVVKVGDKKLTFADPGDVDWRDLATVEIPADLFRVSLNKEDRQHLLDANLPTWKFTKLMKAYYEYYDFEDKIRDARRQAQFG